MGYSNNERGAQMHIEISTDNTITGSDALITDMTALIRHELAHVETHVTRIEAYLRDTNGGKGGPGDIQCTLEARLKGQQPVVAKDAGDTVEQATRGAATKLKSLLDTLVGKLSEHR
jgi:hypothetical protein